MKALLFILSLLAFTKQTSGQICQCSELEKESVKQAQYTDSVYQGLEDSPDMVCRARYFEWLGGKKLDAGRLDSVEQNFIEAQKIYQQQACPESELVQLYKMWAALYYRKGDFSKSLELCLKLSTAAQQSGDFYEQSNVNTMIAQLFNQMGQADKGIEYARKAVPLASQVADIRKRADVLYKISKRYLWHYQDFSFQPSLDSFEILASQHLTLTKQLMDKREMGKAYSNMQGVAYEKKNYKLAIQYLDSSNQYMDDFTPENKAVNYYDLADLHMLDGSYKQALQAADSAMYFYTITGDVAYVAETYELISRIQRGAGNYHAALIAFERGDALKDSLTNLDKSKTFSELEKKYNQEKNEQMIRELSQKQVIYLLLAITSVMVAAVIWILLRQKNLKQRQAILETEQRLNRARMNPHFFFNALASLQEHASRESDGLKVASSLSKFSHVMRKTLESTYNDLVTVETEIEFLNQYLSIQQIRFTDAFTYSVTASDNVEQHVQLLPSMLIQPFVENSIEHGFDGMKGGELKISFDVVNNELRVLIEDNGKGFSSSHESKTHVSRASQIIRDRLYLLNIKYKANARFTVGPGAVGVKAEIYLPLLYQ